MSLTSRAPLLVVKKGLPHISQFLRLGGPNCGPWCLEGLGGLGGLGGLWDCLCFSMTFKSIAPLLVVKKGLPHIWQLLRLGGINCGPWCLEGLGGLGPWWLFHPSWTNHPWRAVEGCVKGGSEWWYMTDSCGSAAPQLSVIYHQVSGYLLPCPQPTAHWPLSTPGAPCLARACQTKPRFTHC